MAAIFNEIAITYKGETHTIKPTFDIINKIETPRLSGGLGISLSGLIARSANGESPLTEVARILAYLLQTKNVTVSNDEMYAELFHGDSTMHTYTEAIATAFFPVKQHNGNLDTKKK
ncbi:hypothetical protein [Prosthecochloris sp.]|uniref:hypothetical protein n=1 Tax=Prosthecochloris sp. TaxID=290513 RepID=UPI0025E32FC7|nr:hypothetical protein [Prosthecochloris sp.]